jgi:hypothetical protein
VDEVAARNGVQKHKLIDLIERAAGRGRTRCTSERASLGRAVSALRP